MVRIMCEMYDCGFNEKEQCTASNIKLIVEPGDMAVGFEAMQCEMYFEKK